MKIYERNVFAFQDKELFSPIRKKTDYAKVVLNSAKCLLVNSLFDKKEERKLKFVIDKMSRIFLSKKNVIISFSFPLTLSELDENQISLETRAGRTVDNRTISLALSILNNEDFLIDSSPMRYWYNSDDPDSIEETIQLIEELLQIEPAYIRYDIDPENVDGKRHPLHHLDVNYSTYGTYKIGLNGLLSEDNFIDILNINTDCYYLSK